MSEFFRQKLKNAQIAVTFQDVMLLPGFCQVEPSQIDITTKVSKNYKLNVPFVSSPMDTVTESEMAIALAREGGLGVLHRNCPIEKQVEMAKKVKKAEATVIREVITVSPGTTVGEALRIMRTHNISGLPVVEGEKLVGILTGRDVRFAREDQKVSEVMTKEVITARDGITIEEAINILHTYRIEKLPLVDEQGRLKGLITFKDISLKGKYPNAARDEKGQLLCAAAISPTDLERAKKLDPYVDILVTDVAHFHNRNMFEATKRLLKEVHADVIVGNIGTFEAAEDILSSLDGVAGFRVGIGSGSICITSDVLAAGAHRPSLRTAQVADALKEAWL